MPDVITYGEAPEQITALPDEALDGYADVASRSTRATRTGLCGGGCSAPAGLVKSST